MESLEGAIREIYSCCEGPIQAAEHTDNAIELLEDALLGLRGHMAYYEVAEILENIQNGCILEEFAEELEIINNELE
ncbi:MAG: hypothetical protein KAS32_09655 [Candidatus Peribacteraceae bacterium]|nr:hypothetical protein [Candidatus Peribacteraceae bacterium]